MASNDKMDDEQFDSLSRAFSEQLLSCLDECARGRHGLFSEPVGVDEGDTGWPEAARLRELAVGLQGILSQQGDRNALCEEFLDLCTMHGEYHPGERRLARSLLERIERGEVGAATEEKRKPW